MVNITIQIPKNALDVKRDIFSMLVLTLVRNLQHLQLSKKVAHLQLHSLMDKSVLHVIYQIIGIMTKENVNNVQMVSIMIQQ